MRKILIVLILILTLTYSDESSECLQCSSDYVEIDRNTESNESVVNGNQNGNTNICSQSLIEFDDLGNEYLNKTYKQITRESWYEGIAQTLVTITEDNLYCFKCNQPEVIHPTPDPEVYERVFDSIRGVLSMKEGVGCKISQPELIEQAEDFRMCMYDYYGTMKVISEKNCCKTSRCFVPIGNNTTDPDDNTTDPDDITTDSDDNTTDPDDITTDPDDITTDPDDITTDSDGSCKIGFSEDSNGDCSLDSDNDGVPDIEDLAPDDPNNSGGDNQDNFCQIDITSCETCRCPLGSVDLGAISNNSDGTSDIRTCSNAFTPIYCHVNETTPINDADCPIGYIPAPDYDNTANCIPKYQPCNYPKPEYYGFKFQSVTADIFRCVDLQFRYANGVGENYNCPDGTVACYYNRNSDTNSTPPNTNPPDTNSTIPPSDSNNTGLGDTTNLENKLNEIKESMNSNANINHNDMISLADTLRGNSNINHTDLSNINNNLGFKLDKIKDAINNQQSPQPTDMTETNQKLDDIKDILEGDTTDDESALQDKFSQILEAGDNALASYENVFNTIDSAIRGTHQFSINISGGGCTGLEFSILNKQINLATGIDYIVNYLRIFIMIWVNLYFTFKLMKLAIIAFQDFSFRAQNMFT